MGLEHAAMALGLSTYASKPHGKHMRIWSDNAGGDSSTRKGAAHMCDHNCIVHSLWVKAMELNAELHVQRLASEDNIAGSGQSISYSMRQARRGFARFETEPSRSQSRGKQSPVLKGIWVVPAHDALGEFVRNSWSTSCDWRLQCSVAEPFFMYTAF